jgi:hypothetical protein
MVIHGEEAATRYFDHQWVESKKRFDQLATPFWTSCIDAEFPRDRARVEAGYAAAIAKYGSPFRYDYGWAASGIGKDKPTFRDIEDAVDAGHYRAHYQWASSDIHAGSKGTYASAPYSLPMLVLGPTDSGLATAGEATLYVLVEMTEDVISLRPSLDAVATLKILRKLAEEAEKGFEKCKLKLEAKEKK